MQTYKIRLTEAEMQAVANALAGFFNWMTSNNSSPSLEQGRGIMSTLLKFKEAVDREKNIIVRLDD